MSGRPPVCKFYKQGKCHYGDSCRFYHPPPENGAFGNSGFNNRSVGAGAFGNSGFGASSSPFVSSSSSLSPTPLANKSVMETVQEFCNTSTISRRQTEMRDDMDELLESLDASNTIYTAYSLKPPAAVNLLSGRDYSFEEDRVAYYLAKATGTLPIYEQEHNARATDMRNSVLYLKRETQKGVRYLQLATQNPNSMTRSFLEPVNLTGQPASNTAPNPFGSGSNPFGSSSTNTQAVSNPFGSSSSNPFGGSTGGAFGSTGFGASTNGSNGAFGSATISSSPFSSIKPSTGASNPFGASSGPFGASKPAASGAFGATGFGAPTTSSIANPFGGNSSVTTSNNNTSNSGSGAFGNSGFGSTSNAFGGSVQSTAQPTSTTQQNPFGSGSTATPSPFGSSPFGASAQTPFNGGFTSSFGASSNNAFGSVGGFGNSGSALMPSGNAGYKQCDVEVEQTKLEDIGGKILEAFKADSFVVGCVPDIPPPLELC